MIQIRQSIPLSDQQPDNQADAYRNANGSPCIFMNIFIGYPRRDLGFIDYRSFEVLQVFLGQIEVLADFFTQGASLPFTVTAYRFHQFLGISNYRVKILYKLIPASLAG
jgi:hypothetical protein